jgi:hypothetical protein
MKANVSYSQHCRTKCSSSVTSRLGPTGPFRLQDYSKTVLSISSLVVVVKEPLLELQARLKRNKNIG